jgi:hypothetical protein
MKRRLPPFATWFWLAGYLLATSTATLFHDAHAHGDVDCNASLHHAHEVSHDDCVSGHDHEEHDQDDSSNDHHSCAVCDYLAQASVPVIVVNAPAASAEVRPVAEMDYRAPAVGVRIDCRSRAPPV